MCFEGPIVNRRERIVILAHGGAGARRSKRAQIKELAASLEAGFSLLKNGGSSLDAVEAVIRQLEDSGHFNAGRGSRLQMDGRCRMDASIMEGRDLKSGAVASIEDVRNPITVARLVMEKTPHVLIAGKGAIRLARFFKIPKGPRPHKNALMILKKVLREKKGPVHLYRSIYGHETVGAVALDSSGTLAAGASTGGISAMLPGRIGDSPLIGAGVYADNQSGAASLTGLGETIIRSGTATEICCYLRDSLSPRQATEKALKRMLRRIQGEAGAIVLNRDGQFAIHHTTPYMCAGYRTGEQRVSVDFRFRRVR